MAETIKPEAAAIAKICPKNPSKLMLAPKYKPIIPDNTVTITAIIDIFIFCPLSNFYLPTHYLTNTKYIKHANLE